MYLAELRFKIIADTQLALAEQAIRGYLEALIFNGQVLGREFPTALQQTAFVSRVVIPQTTALHRHCHSQQGLQQLQRLASAGLGYPQLTVLGEDLMSQHTSPTEAPAALIMFSTFADNCSILRCIEHFAPVPLYRFAPVDAIDHQPLIRWQIQFQALDEIQSQQNRVLPKVAENSLQQLHSKLNRQGRSLANAISQRNKLPVYYALYSGSSSNCATEAAKPCPGCAAPWRLAEPLHQIFDFKCEQCRLLGNIAWDCQA
ncbi:DUF2310 family Zn-ribbon-containing protein [Arsukibacterium sp.]|uniref:DUF2310 family Zn-ribbon-containing protein n=1 Tax=Arsukibacterium sp. TaxID=1977258 RepID=UPI002FD96914